RRVARRPERLRVDARVLGPEDTEVAHGRRRHEAAAAEDAHGQVLGEPVRQRELTPADEVTLLEEPAEDARAELTHGDGARLLPERRLRVDQPAAVVAARAPDALGVVVDEVAALVVEERRQTEPVAEEVEPGRGRDLVTRQRVALEGRL